MVKKPKVLIEPETMRRIRGFTHLASGEVGGMARVTMKNGNFYVHDLLLLPDQKVSAASVHLDTEKLALFLSIVDNPDEFKFLWHSHVNMSATLSGVDDNCIDGILETSPYIISCVTNKRNEIYAQIDFKIEGVRLSLSMDVEVDVDFTDLQQELKDNVKEEQPRIIPSTKYGYGYHGGYRSDPLFYDHFDYFDNEDTLFNKNNDNKNAKENNPKKKWRFGL